MPPYFRGRLVEDTPAKNVIRFLILLFASVFLCIFIAIGLAMRGFQAQTEFMKVVLPMVFLGIVFGAIGLSEVKSMVRFVVNGSGVEIEYLYKNNNKRMIQTGDIISFALMMQYHETNRSRFVNVPYFTLHITLKNQTDPVVVRVRPREVSEIVGQIHNYGFALTENVEVNLHEYKQKLLWSWVIDGGVIGGLVILYLSSQVFSFWR